MECDELNKKYAMCFVKIKGEVFKILEFSQNFQQQLYVQVENFKGRTQLICLDDIDINFNILDVGLYNYKNNVIIVKKTGDRQWKRGFSKGAYLVQHPLSHPWTMWAQQVGRGLYQMLPFAINIDCISKVFKPYDSYKKAHTEVMRDNVLARAFDKSWFICLSMDSDGLWLFYRTAKVATIINGKIMITNTAFHEEVRDLNRKHCIGEIVC